MFVTQGPVDPESRLFVGRAAELRKMESWLTQVKCVGAVLGARQTGKTSLLLKLRHAFREKYAFAFLDLQAISGANVTECFTYIAEEMLGQLREITLDAGQPLPKDGKDFLAFLQRFSTMAQAVRIIVILDEIGALPAETALKLSSTIRAAFTNRLIKQEYARYIFVLAGATDMLELTTGRNSPLKNVTESIYLGDLSLTETAQLLAEAFGDAPIRPLLEIHHHLHTWTSGHPYWTQLLASHLEGQPQLPTEEAIRSIVEHLLQTEDRNLPHVLGLLKKADAVLVNLVESLLKGSHVPFSRSNGAVAKLELIGILKNQDGRCTIRNKLYQEAVQRQLAEEGRFPQSLDPAETVTEGLKLGMVLKDRYRIERELGRGAMGIAYLARDQHLHSKPVVIKVLLEKSDQDLWRKTKFRQEIEALARIDHPGVVGVVDAGELPDGKPFLVMQYVEGQNLRSALKPEGMEFDRVGTIMRQIGQALSAAHNKGVCHCDLKPENIMLQDLGEGDEVVKLIDFGLARVRDSRVATSTDIRGFAGTIPYMAPEQLHGKPSSSSDIYALGVIASEMLTGRRPFTPESLAQLLKMQRDGVRVKPKDLRPNLREAAQEVILKALSYDPEDRYVRARELGERLARALTADSTLRQRTTSTRGAT